MIPDPAFRVLQRAFEDGRAEDVVTSATGVLDIVRADDRQRGLVPAVLLLVGGALAHLERYGDASAYLARGLADLPGSSSAHELGTADRFALTLIDLWILQGRYREAWELVQELIVPERVVETRLAATRAQVGITATFGDFDTAAHLLNTAAGLAQRAHSRQLASVVDGDRALVLARQGRTTEAVAFADQALEQLSRPGRGPQFAWSAAQATTVAATVGRQVAVAGDLVTAERLMFQAADCATRTGRSFDVAQVALARSVVWRTGGRVHDAEAPLLEARRIFLALGCAPAAALAQAEEVRLATARGLAASVPALVRRARNELSALGLTRELAELAALAPG